MLAFITTLYITITSWVFGYDEATLLFVGDAMQHQAQLDAARQNDGSYSYTGCFDALVSDITEADYAVVNLETPIGAKPHSGYPCFNAPEAYLDALVDAGFDLFLTANNHTLDRGPKGLRSTIKALDERNLDHLGTYATDSEREESLPLVVVVNNIKFGFLNYTYGTNGINPRDGVVVDYIDRPKIVEDVKALRDAGAEILIVCIHWGDEYHLTPNKSQQYTADFLEALGVDAVVGAHPHVIQPLEVRKNKYYPEKDFYLCYSLGNFISNMKTTNTRGGAMTTLRYRRGDDGVVRLDDADYKLLFTIPPTEKGDNFRVMPLDSVPAGMWQQRAIDFSTNARKIYKKHNIGINERK